MSDKKEEEVVSLDDGAEGEDVQISLMSKESEKLTVSKKHAFISSLVKTALEQDSSSQEVPIPGVTKSTLEKVIEYMVHHEGKEPALIPKPLRSSDMKAVCTDKWDATYIDNLGENRQDLYDLILAANYMDVKSLLHLGCAKVASLIKGQPLDQIKEILKPKGKTEAKTA